MSNETMTENEKLYLQEMGISLWQLHHPERMMGYEMPTFSLPEECQLLLIAPSCPISQTALFFEKVLKSLQLELSQARHITPEQLSALEPHSLQWVWFAGCSVQPLPMVAKVLQSPELAQIDGHNEHRRALWQQIRSYE
ncbi:DNA polymerase III subunit psi [Vibrio vulnificus]|nr:DNA polymerase III subunit psi [Vibrio vulnificus]EHH0710500.1 DNA polymerase III subunit psi [Vibrio vulnificus]EHH1184178.1 DNA polymerase III subunit psi [Vibrio vulnificus]EHH2487026.1 DNA polymerase III subunit psi [Vibrio vulnificus]EHI9277770.1 DNA polymerase III subunit psi [Vibrio vulnificus]